MQSKFQRGDSLEEFNTHIYHPALVTILDLTWDEDSRDWKRFDCTRK